MDKPWKLKMSGKIERTPEKFISPKYIVIFQREKTHGTVGIVQEMQTWRQLSYSSSRDIYLHIPGSFPSLPKEIIFSSFLRKKDVSWTAYILIVIP